MSGVKCIQILKKNKEQYFGNFCKTHFRDTAYFISAALLGSLMMSAFMLQTTTSISTTLTFNKQIIIKGTTPLITNRYSPRRQLGQEGKSAT